MIDFNTLPLKIGTRGSPLALAQAHATRSRLSTAHQIDPAKIEIIILKTTGDMIRDRALSEAGGKGLFTKELDIALLAGEIDLAVHSAKDMPTLMPAGVEISGYLLREDVRDAFISAKSATLLGLPAQASFGSASLRRQAQALRLRPDLKPALLRGNVETRLEKVESGACDCTLLALAGLKRLGLADRVTEILDIADFLPAVGQGAIALVAREGDARVAAALAPILDTGTTQALSAERAFLRVLDGSCRTPIAGYARLHHGRLQFRGEILSIDGTQSFDVSFIGRPEDAARLGEDAGHELLVRTPPEVLSHR
jgi:hydroxymethylbilane synthase